MNLKSKAVLYYLLIICLMVVQGCVMSNKKNITTAYSVYNSQYAMYMTDTGHVLTERGDWEKVTNPVLSTEKKELLRKKKNILSQIYPLIKVYDSMLIGTTPFSEKTERDLFNLIDQLILLTN